MFCHKCGAVLTEDAAFCSVCGAPIKTGEEPVTHRPLRAAIGQFFTPVRPSAPEGRTGSPARLSLTRALILLGAVVLFFAIWRSLRDQGSAPADQNSGRYQAATPSGTTETPKLSSSDALAGRPSVKLKIGQELSVGYWSYTVNSISWQRIIGSPGYTVETPDAEFLVVDLSIRNNDRTASTLPPFELIDEQGREYDESEKGTSMQGSFGMLKKLNPGVSSRGYLVFDVPRGEYVLKAPGGFQSGESALVDLSPPIEMSPPVPAKSSVADDRGAGSTGEGTAHAGTSLTAAMPTPHPLPIPMTVAEVDRHGEFSTYTAISLQARVKDAYCSLVGGRQACWLFLEDQPPAVQGQQIMVWIPDREWPEIQSLYKIGDTAQLTCLASRGLIKCKAAVKGQSTEDLE